MLRDYQLDAKARVYAAWQAGAQNVMMVLPTGAGKTVVFCSILAELNVPAVVIAHRQELTAQAALALNREKVPHGVICPDNVIRQIVAVEMETHGYSMFNSRAAVRVAGVDTLIRREAHKDRWYGTVQTVVVDEGHHVLNGSKWAEAMGMFPSARGLLPTAHALRADGAGLGRHSDGLVDALVVGPSCRDLINRGYLCDYRLIAPPSDIDISDVPIGASGDYSNPKLRIAVHRSKTIIGDVIRHYLKFARGKLGLTFVVDVEAAKEIAAAYRASGVPAEVITAKTPIAVRAALMRKFRARQLLQLVSVETLGEGVDVPAVEVVSMARATASYQWYSQMVGRGLRIAEGKDRAIIIDHVQNYARHGLPDVPRTYTLDRQERRSRGKTDGIPLKVCLNLDCLQPYEAYLPTCPYCGNKPVPGRRSAPEYVDGDLTEIDPDVLRQMRGEIDRIDRPPTFPANADHIVVASIKRNHWERQQAQLTLRSAIALWAGWQRQLGRSDSESYRRFYHGFGTDVASAQALGRSEAESLEAKIRTELDRNGVIPQ